MDIRKTWLCTKPIAHRGLHSATVPENSLAAFEAAIERGYAIELDVRPIDDGTVIVFHDDKLTRMTNRDGYACNLTTADLEEIRLVGSNEKIPTFKEVLDLVAGRTPILIEIKNTDTKVGQLEKDVLEFLSSYTGEYAIQSFNPFSVEYFKKNAPGTIRGQLSCFFTDQNSPSFFKRFLLKRLKLNKVSSPDFIAYDHRNLPNKYVTKTKLPVLAWTVCSNSEMEKVRPYCDNIIFQNFLPEINE